MIGYALSLVAKYYGWRLLGADKGMARVLARTSTPVPGGWWRVWRAAHNRRNDTVPESRIEA